MALFFILKKSITMKTSTMMKKEIMTKRAMKKILDICQTLILNQLQKDLVFLKLAIGAILAFHIKTQKAFLVSLSMVKVMKDMADMKKKPIMMKLSIMKKKPITMKKSIMKRVSTKVREFFLIQNLMFLTLKAHIL